MTCMPGIPSERKLSSVGTGLGTAPGRMQLRRRTVGEAAMAAPTSPRNAIKTTASTTARKSKVAAEPRPFLEEVSRGWQGQARAAVRWSWLRTFRGLIHFQGVQTQLHSCPVGVAGLHRVPVPPAHHARAAVHRGTAGVPGFRPAGRLHGREHLHGARGLCRCLPAVLRAATQVRSPLSHCG